MNIEDINTIIATEANLATLEMYRGDHSNFFPSDVDQILDVLKRNIITAIEEYVGETADDDMVEISLKFEPGEFERMANDYAAELAKESKQPQASIGPDAEQNEESRTSTDGGEPDTLSADEVDALWARAPEWANWWARDRNDHGYYYSDKPCIAKAGTRWDNCDLSAFEITKADLAPGVDWKGSLRIRPAKNPVSTSEQDDPESPANERETAPETATETRDRRPAEPSPVVGDEAETGSAPSEQPEKVEKKPIDNKFFQAFREWMALENLSYCEAARRAGVSDPTILSLAKGTTRYPTKPTKKKILAAIRKDQKAAASKPTKEPATTDAPKATAERDMTPGGLLSRQLKQWLECQSLDAFTASSVLSVSVNVLQDILEGHLPVNNIIHQLSKHIPTTRANYKFFMNAVKAQKSECDAGEALQ